jgi:hypothetical protein
MTGPQVRTSRFNVVLVAFAVWYAVNAALTMFTRNYLQATGGLHQVQALTMLFMVGAAFVYAVFLFTLAMLRYRGHPHATLYTRLLGALLVIYPISGTILGLYMLFWADRRRAS